MRLNFQGHTSPPSAVVLNDSVIVFTLNDGLDLIANAHYLGARHVIARAEHFCPDFFDLSTGLAGEILQKFANYRLQLTVLGDWSIYSSQALQDFMLECNRGESFRFATDEAAR